jgi:hypothetical protein
MKLTAFLVTATIFIACNNNDKPAITAATTTRLTESTLYNTDSVRAALASTNDALQSDAKKKFLEAIDLIKNKKQIAQSIAAFKASLLIYPSEKTYFELGSALAENKNYEEALKALDIAEQMDYSPLANILYKKSLIYATMPNSAISTDGYTKINDSLALHFMEVALQTGYAKPTDFLKEKAFDSLRFNSDWYFKNVYHTAMSGNKDPEKLAWDNYRDEFKELTLPLAINTAWIYQQNYENAIGYDYEKFVPEMRTGKFSREVENEYFYVGKIKEDSAFTALLYAGKNMWLTDGRGYNPVYFYLVTYNPQGKILDKMQVGGQKTFTDNFKNVTLKENLSLEIKEFKNVYEKDPSKDGYENNKVVKSELLTTAYYRINAKGKFEKAEKDQLALR